MSKLLGEYMYFTTETKTIPLRDDTEMKDKVRCSVNDTHNVISIPFIHSNEENTEVKISDEPFTVEISSFDNTKYYTLKTELTLNKEITSLQNIFYKFDKEYLHLHIPNKNLQLRKKPQKVTIPYEKNLPE